jgi:hypothetical protein
MALSTARTRLEDMVRAQRRALTAQWGHPRGNIAYIGVAAPTYLTMRGRLFGGRTELLAGIAEDRALVYIDDEDRPELWVKPVLKGGPGSSNYDTDWNNFAKRYYGFDFNTASTSEYNVDHMFPETTGMRKGLSHVRVMPVDASANTAVGRTIEAQMAKRLQQPDKVIHKATFMTFAKVSGFDEQIVLPEDRGGPVEEQIIRRLIVHLQRRRVVEPGPSMRALHMHLTRWSVTRIQGGDVDALGTFEP